MLTLRRRTRRSSEAPAREGGCQHNQDYYYCYELQLHSSKEGSQLVSSQFCFGPRSLQQLWERVFEEAPLRHVGGMDCYVLRVGLEKRGEWSGGGFLEGSSREGEPVRQGLKGPWLAV